MHDHTVVLLAGREVGLIPRACAMARLLQPSMVILEDVDLIAEDRNRQEPGCTPLLLELLNEMDGLSDDADVIFLLTSNRPELLEPALAARPGRVDLAVEVPLPDAACRRRLIELYGHGLALHVDGDDLDRLVQRIEGVAGLWHPHLGDLDDLVVLHGDPEHRAVPGGQARQLGEGHRRVRLGGQQPVDGDGRAGSHRQRPEPGVDVADVEVVRRRRLLPVLGGLDGGLLALEELDQVEGDPPPTGVDGLEQDRVASVGEHGRLTGGRGARDGRGGGGGTGGRGWRCGGGAGGGGAVGAAGDGEHGGGGDQGGGDDAGWSHGDLSSCTCPAQSGRMNFT
jgi:hypothetical protein